MIWLKIEIRMLKIQKKILQEKEKTLLSRYHMIVTMMLAALAVA